MTKIDDKVEELLAKHPNLTKPEAIEILAAKNARKKQKRADKAERIDAKIAKSAEKRANRGE
ncbi:Uncharacterised protein [BD1-7 clade bacterium]|uniref:Uncharacterized protein n=1 Tax=BD1-7 clade bacterium TaxID=2029982 RepID=A0A5S9NPY5_9GAMM|nr:Uncharacterised protein [BD1-7 clade bacterium]